MANEIRKYQNFVGGLVDDNPLTSGATTLTSAGLAAITGGVASTEHMVIVLDPDGLFGAPEIAYITALTAGANSATIVRGKDGTTARQHDRDVPWVHSTIGTEFTAPYFHGYRNAASSPSSNAALGILSLDAEVADTHGVFDVATGKFTVPAEYPGLWRITIYGSWSSSATGIRIVGVFKNGVSDFQSKQNAAGSGSTFWSASVDEVLVAGDYLEWAQAQNSGAGLALNVGAKFSCGMSGQFQRFV